MLRPVLEPIRYEFVRLTAQWDAIVRELPEGWGDARLKLTVTDAGQARAAAARLPPLQPGVRGRELRFYTASRGTGAPAPRPTAFGARSTGSTASASAARSSSWRPRSRRSSRRRPARRSPRRG